MSANRITKLVESVGLPGNSAKVDVVAFFRALAKLAHDNQALISTETSELDRSTKRLKQQLQIAKLQYDIDEMKRERALRNGDAIETTRVRAFLDRLASACRTMGDRFGKRTVIKGKEVR